MQVNLNDEREAIALPDPWREAMIDELVVCHIYSAKHDDDPKQALHDAITWNVTVALDPAVSSDAAALVEKGRVAGLLEAATIADELGGDRVERGRDYAPDKHGRTDALINAQRVRAQTISCAIRLRTKEPSRG